MSVVRVAHLSDIHVAHRPKSVGTAVVAFLERTVPYGYLAALGASGLALLYAAFSRPDVEEAFLNQRRPDDVAAKRLEKALRACLIVAGAGLAGGAAAVLFPRLAPKVIRYWCSLRPDRPRRREILLEWLSKEPIDHVVITGDLTTIADPAEFATARQFLDDLKSSAKKKTMTIMVTPGNHDVQSTDEGKESDRLSFFKQHLGQYYLPPKTPGWWECDSVRFLGLDSTLASRGIGIDGRVSDEELEVLRRFIQDSPRGTGIVFLHHHLKKRGMPVVDPTGRNPLKNAPVLRQHVADNQNIVILHGHEHKMYAGAKGFPPTYCAGATTMVDALRAREMRYNLFEYDGAQKLEDRPPTEILIPLPRS